MGSDVYRTSGFTCPSCPHPEGTGSPGSSLANSSLREFHDRFVCDECGGMLIGVADFTASIHEIDGSTAPLEFLDVTPSSQGCPKCARAMSTSRLTLGELETKVAVARCERDGLWMPRDVMSGIFASVSRRVHSGIGDGHGYGGVSGTGGVSAGGLTISRWRDKAKPRVHTLYVSAHRERRLGCPSCKESALEFEGDRWGCAACAGSFVENAALAAMVEEMSKQPWHVPVVSGAPGERACPLCASAMIVEVLEAVTVDRCAAHGVWFDESELADALQHASEPDPGTSVGGWLKRLFHRHGTTED